VARVNYFLKEKGTQSNMIDITNFTEPIHNEFDINLCQKDVGGGIISYEQIDEIEKFTDAKTIIISGLKQDTFEYFVTRYADQFEAISFWKNKGVENLSCLGELKKIKYINYFFNQSATTLWDMSANINLLGLGIYDFSKLHNINMIEAAPNLKSFHIGDKVTRSMTIQSFKPLVNTEIKHFEWWGKAVNDNDFTCLSQSHIEELEINPTQFTLEELTDLLAYFPETLKGSITRPYVKTGIKDSTGYREYYTLCKRKKMCEKGKDDERFQKYLQEFELMLNKKRKR
jgi:hypothetical protein